MSQRAKKGAKETQTSGDDAYLPRIAKTDFNGDVIATCVALQKHGNLTGPSHSVAAQLVLCFRDVTISLDQLSVREEEDLTASMMEYYMKDIVGASLEAHEANFADFLRSEKKIMNWQASMESFLQASKLPTELMQAIQSTADKVCFEKFIPMHAKFLKKHYKMCMKQRCPLEERKKTEVTAYALRNVNIEVATAWEQMMCNQDEVVRQTVESRLIAGMLEIAFPVDCISRTAKSETELLELIRHGVDEGCVMGEVGDIFRSVRTSFMDAVKEAARLVFGDVRRGLTFCSAFDKHFANGNPGKMLPGPLKPELKSMAEVFDVKISPVVATYQNDVAVMKEEVQRLSDISRKGKTGWSGFQKLWYDAEDKKLHLLCASSEMYYLSKHVRGTGTEVEKLETRNAFLVASPKMYNDILNLEVTRVSSFL